MAKLINGLAYAEVTELIEAGMSRPYIHKVLNLYRSGESKYYANIPDPDHTGRGSKKLIQIDTIANAAVREKVSQLVTKLGSKIGNTNSMKRTPEADRLIIEIYEIASNKMSIADMHTEYSRKAHDMGLPALSYGTVYYYIKSLEFYKETLKSINHDKIS